MKAEEFYHENDNYINFNDIELSDLFELMTDFSEHQNKELIDNIKQTIENLESKHKSFLGTNGEMARANFKLGLDWGIEGIRTILRNWKAQ